MTDLFSYPSSPGFKTPGTSQEAAHKIQGKASALRDQVERLFLTGATLTADECAEALHESVLAVRPRLSELVAKGLIVKSFQDGKPERRKNASGLSAQVWRAA
jgi:predicted ArsR family transcriptional regulator